MASKNEFIKVETSSLLVSSYSCLGITGKNDCEFPVLQIRIQTMLDDDAPIVSVFMWKFSVCYTLFLYVLSIIVNI